MNRSCLLSIAVFTASASAVLAHITLEKEEAPAESFYKAVLRVPHGCEGSATVKVRVQIPEGVIAVKPMPKAGWQLEMLKGKYEKSYNYSHHFACMVEALDLPRNRLDEVKLLLPLTRVMEADGLLRVKHELAPHHPALERAIVWVATRCLI